MNNLEKVLHFKVDSSDFEGMRLDKLISNVFKDLSRSRVANLIKANNVFVNNILVSKNYKSHMNDEICIYLPKLKHYELKPENIPLDIVYEDDDLLIVNKPQNMVVHPANGNYTGTMVNALLYYCKDNLSGINGVARPGIVHRIDKNTSGLLVVAKNDKSHIDLSSQIRNHSFKRVYHAVVYGKFKDNVGMVNLPIGRSIYNRKKMCVTYKNSKNAKTLYSVIKNFNKFSYIELTLETGRTHQIRVHMSYIGHHIAGDDVYGPKKNIKNLNLCGQCLHAKIIGFIHPTKKKYVEFDSKLPAYFEQFLSECENIL